MNTFGSHLRLTTAGESHGPVLCGILDGMPSGITADEESLQKAMGRRAPGGAFGTKRREADTVEILSGIYKGKTTGAPIAFVIRNADARSEDYTEISQAFRPSHADYTYNLKYGHYDPRGGGRSSARETALRVAAGAMAAWVLTPRGINCVAYTQQIGRIRTMMLPEDEATVWVDPLYCPDAAASAQMREELRAVAGEGDTVGGIVGGIITGLGGGFGDPVYGKLHARLGGAMLSINAAHGFDYGMGFAGCCGRGSELNDKFITTADGRIVCATNNSGGIQGGISTGAPITFRVGFKPIPTLGREQETVSRDGERIILHPRGRHDVCALPRAVPVVQAMARLTILDAILSSGK